MSQAQVITFTPEVIAAAVKKIVTASKSASRAIETVLVMAVYDSVVNQSGATANALIGALRVSTKRDGIVAFLEKFGQLYNKGGKLGFVHFALGLQAAIVWDADYVELVQEAAQDWESFKPTPPDSVFDVLKAVEAIVKKAGQEGAKCTDADLVPYLSALIAQYTSKKALAKAAESAKVAELPLGQVPPTVNAPEVPATV